MIDATLGRLTDHRSNILDHIVACAKVLDEADRKDRTCPECSFYPVNIWLVPRTTSWRRCPQCDWTDKHDYITEVSNDD